MTGCLSRLLVASLVLILIAAAVLVVGTYTFLPPMLEGKVASNVQDSLSLGTTPEVDLRSDPPPAMLAGRFSGGNVSLGATDLGGVRAETVGLELDPFDLDVPASVRSGALRSERPLSGTLRAELSEAEVSRLVRSGSDVPIEDLRLGPDGVTVRSAATAFGFEVPVIVEGDLVLSGGELVFEPRRTTALGTAVPDEFSDQLLEQADLSYPLEGLPYGAEVTSVEVQTGRLVLAGQIERLRLGDG